MRLNSFQHFLFIYIFIFITAALHAQQEPKFTMYWNNLSIFNPAVSGLIYRQYASVTTRHQWACFTGAPKTITALYDMRVKPLHGGIGVNYLFDELGFEKNHEFRLNYSYQIVFENHCILSLGISGGIMRHYMEFSKLETIDNDPYIPQNDEWVLRYITTGGVYLKSRHWEGGISMKQLYKTQSRQKTEYGRFEYPASRQYWLTSAYTIDLPGSLVARPGFLLMTDETTWTVDVNLLLMYRSRYWAGITYRNDDMVAFMGGIDIAGKFRVGYAYDVFEKSLRKSSQGSHEIVLSFMTGGIIAN